ncbi:Non-specific serine/threonine protein kinase [Sulfidibacter corallicola]|uniref:Serine/threonine protein kinase n=1 Tax=Sulfidibacter corallicola TaxID=2818388 RepID=A0A8A4TN42_SULCO|nr:serine/threonine-protein kinase [Sulfidibacter corallicola]QTD50522.1 serine/threonine protein kinase [Sulfidibacter corallicola]
MERFAEEPAITWDPQVVERGPATPGADDDSGTITRIGAYQVERELGRGGMGRVFLATRADDTYKKVAIKILKRGMDTEDILRRFYQEQQILARLKHPYIAHLYDVGQTDTGLPFFVMEYIHGKPIDHYAAHHDLSTKERLELFMKVCRVVSYAHQNLVVHRDLKPANILVTADGNPKLLDFGIAGLLDPVSMAPQAATAKGKSMLTIDYASPEQLRGERLDTRTDVFSLGVILYELLAGTRPYHYASQNPLVAEERIAEGRPDPVSEAAQRQHDRRSGEPSREKGRWLRQRWTGARSGQRLGADLDNLLFKALAYDSRYRYGSVEVFEADIRRYLQCLPVHAHATSYVYRLRKFSVRNRWTITAAAFFCGLLIGFSFYALHLKHQSERERDKAESTLRYLVDIFDVNDPKLGPSMTAKDLLERGAQNIEHGLVDQPQIRADLQYALGAAYHGLGLTREAKPLAAAALAARRLERPLDGEAVTQAAYLMGALHLNDMAYEQALTCFEEAETHSIASHGVDSERTMVIKNGIGTLYCSLGKFDLAEDIFVEVHDIGVRVLGENHPKTMVGLSQLAVIYGYQRKSAEAIDAYSRALNICREVEGPLNAHTLGITHNLANEYAGVGEYDKAIDLFRQLVEGSRKMYMESHVLVVSGLTGLGSSLLATGQLAEAERILYEALEAMKNNEPATRRRIVSAHIHLGTIHYKRGDREKAEAFFRKALGIALNTFPDDHHFIARARVRLGELYLGKGDLKQARSLLQEAVFAYRKKYSDDNAETAIALSILGSCLAAEGRFEEAEPMLRESHRNLQKYCGKSVSIHNAWVRIQEFERLRQQALAGSPGG